MAARITHILVDDLDGSAEEVTTRRFSVDGVDYEIDLSPANSHRLDQALAPFRQAARRPAQDPPAATPPGHRPMKPRSSSGTRRGMATPVAAQPKHKPDTGTRAEPMSTTDVPEPAEELWTYAGARLRHDGQLVDTWVDPGGTVLHFDPYRRRGR